MTKLFAILPALALVVALSGSAMAENGAISNATLNDMGLAGMELMSDADAMAVRGMGFDGGNNYEMPMGNKPWSLAFGVSIAYIGVEGGEGGIGAGAGSIDGFIAEGKFMASGSHLSEALISKSITDELWLGGILAKKTVWTKSLSIAAGGTASALSL